MCGGVTRPPREGRLTSAFHRHENATRARKYRRRSSTMDMAPPNAIPDDLLINASDEIRIRQDLVLTALGHRTADRALRVGRLLDVHSRTWSEDQEIVFKGRRIVWVGPAGSYQGEV